MKTRAMKKVLSVICVLALLMSVCVVSLVADAAETYTLNINGNTETVQLEAGTKIPDPSAPYEFLGWYDSLQFTNKVETAGEAKTLYAKFNSLVLDFENDGWAYAPNDNFVGRYTVVADPVNEGNKVLKFRTGGSRYNFGIPTYVGSNEGYCLVQDQKYEIAFDYYVDLGNGFEYISTSVRSTDLEGVGTTNGTQNNSYPSYRCYNSSGRWGHASVIFTASQITDVNKYLSFSGYISGSGTRTGSVYFDNFTITPIASDKLEYSLNNKGVVSKTELEIGASLPEINGAAFQGWYDKTLTVRYDTAPAAITKLYAKYNKLAYDFETGMEQLFDPLDVYDTNGWVEFIKDGDNTVLKLDSSDAGCGFAVAGAYGAQAGYTITKGQVYTIRFMYKSEKDTSFAMYTSADTGIGADGNKSELGWTDTLSATSEWTSYEKQFVLDASSEINLNSYDNLFFAVNDATIYLDDFRIAPYVPKVSAEDIEMDFEDDFKWSVADANNYTTSSGNGYVNRGEIVTDANNKYFRVKHFGARNAYIYFTADNGTTHFTVVNGGIYTVEFDYMVEYSETSAAIGLLYAKPTTNSTGLDYSKLVEFDTFGNRADEDWIHVSYTFNASLDKPDCTSLGFYVYNTTNVPEFSVETGAATATSVLFDNIVIKTHSNTGEDGLIVFDSLGGSNCTPIVSEGDVPVGVLPQPTKYGYTFKGWKYDTIGAGDTVISNDLTANTKMPYGITEAYAVWELEEGVVELNFRTNIPSYDATAPSLVAYSGKPIEGFPSENPVASNGSKFEGWFYDTAFTKKVDPNVAPSESCTIYAKWSNSGMKFDFENFPHDSKGKPSVYTTDRFTIQKINGNKVAYYDFSSGANQTNVSRITTMMLHDGNDYMTAVEGIEYTITFKYKVVEAKGEGMIGAYISSKNSTWTNSQKQGGSIKYGEATNEWREGTITFTATYAAGSTTDNNYLSFGFSNDAKIYLDDVVVKSSINNMNIYGSAVIFNTNGGKELNIISGDAGAPINLPTPVRPGFEFIGWYTDSTLTTPFTDTTFSENQITLYAKWQLGKFTEDFEDYPNTVMQLGIHGAYSRYTDKTVGFDASNVKSGATSLFRNGVTAGSKVFTAMRSQDLALTIGETYTLKFYVKPTAIGDASGSISIFEMASSTGINNGTQGAVIANVAELKEGEWNLVTYTFTAKSEFIGISTTAGNDMYFDDVVVTRKGYTGSDKWGDSSVSPILVIAMVIVSAGALLITGKKVFSK